MIAVVRVDVVVDGKLCGDRHGECEHFLACLAAESGTNACKLFHTLLRGRKRCKQCLEAQVAKEEWRS